MQGSDGPMGFDQSGTAVKMSKLETMALALMRDREKDDRQLWRTIRKAHGGRR